MTIIIALFASVAAFLGGYIALRFRDKLHIILGLSAGAVIGAALFDLIPEAIELTEGVYHAETVLALTALGFFTYLILDRIFSFHSHEEDLQVDDGHLVTHDSTRRGSLGAASFSLHSLIDGIAIGLAFQASAEIGTVVAIAVIAHRFSDGINTIGVILKHHGQNRQAWAWLSVVALAPIVGAALTFLISVSDQSLAILLAVFSGSFLYIGASDLIPEGHHSHSKILTTVMTLVGAAILFVIVQLAH
jgi:zinc transporter ZupT